MQSKATTVEQYLTELPADRRAALQAVRKVILANLDKRGFAEGMSYGMIGYYVPHSVYPAGYHCDPTKPVPFAGLASQKGHMSLYLMSLYGENEGASDQDAEWFQDAWAKTGKKLDMGKACIRFKKVDDLALDVIAQAIARMPAKRFIEYYERAVGPDRVARGAGASGAKKKTAKKAPAAATKRATPKPAAKKKSSAASSKKKR